MGFINFMLAKIFRNQYFGNNNVLKMNKYVVLIIGFVGQMMFSSTVQATLTSTVSDAWSTLSNNVTQTWQAPEHYDLYVPVITWHARFAYDQDKIDKYNEHPWGAGFGMSRWNESGNWNGLYLMAFKDSFNKWEPIAGYGWEKTWRPLTDDNFHLGLGYTLGVTARDNWNYIPLPVILPLASVGYGPATFQMTYIPGTYNNGNVYFAWLRFQF